MKKILRKILGKEDYKKLMLIKKYAKIRFRRFWKEWGISKQEALDLLSCMLMFGMLAMFYIIGCMF